MSQFPEFEYRQQQLMIEDCAIKDLADEFGTPLYIYSKKALQQRWQELQNAFSETSFLPCFAVKANSNLAILQLLASWGAGFDIVSMVNSSGCYKRVVTQLRSCSLVSQNVKMKSVERYWQG